MLFNEPAFLFGFLPVTLAGFFIIAALGRTQLALLWLAAASLFFYGWWRLDFLPLMLASLVFNFGIGLLLSRQPRRWLLVLGIAANLAALGWFKYSGFLASLINDTAGLGLPVPQVILPLAISFYTFNQIAYLVDAHAGEARETSFTRYVLFVTFFPHLIAGPIVHHREMLPQFALPETYRPQLQPLVLGLAAFAIGLFKKVVIADPLAPLAAMAFGPAADGSAPHFLDAWLGSIAFSLQLYFDFSGYSDMAIGLGLMFGIMLPINFASPYKAASIIEFWQRWHMTLTRFLTGYIYNPIVMALTRRRVQAGKPLLKRSAPTLGPFLVLLALPTLITMGLAGVWHGAGWQFVVFGLLHALLLIVNHAWRALRQALGIRSRLGWFGHATGVLATFLAVTVTLVFFKSSSLDQALQVVRGMAGFGGDLPYGLVLGGIDPATMNPFQLVAWRLFTSQGALICIALAVVWLLPNTSRYLELVREALAQRPASGDAAPAGALRQGWAALMPQRAGLIEGGVIGVLLGIALLRAASVAPTEFLYFTF
ncbi:MAG TPA: MBOAT family O-acyltransferase [Ferrovibrio sp.]|jgi:D-alanyl-lipoteichoic acid acyltransferase DltB (MBOAT superfamily)|uniref:MBOAT family O-acyltransferase n=1 Tax=Ferrovibrio sp. TaxID=1917215 RepID=UPI002ED58925